MSESEFDAAKAQTSADSAESPGTKKPPITSAQFFDSLLLIEDFLRYGCRSGRKVEIPLPGGLPADTSLATRKAQLEALAARVSECTACALSESRTHTVFGEGVSDPEVLVIGEGPGAEEDPQGRPFAGASGKLLDKMLAAIGLSRQTNCYIGNIVKCRPPNNREPTPIERAACIGYLRAQIAILKPRFILCVGRTAAHGLLDLADPISRLRGRTFEFEGIPVVITFHPSALLRDASLKRPAWEDLKRFRALIDGSSRAGE
jgi:uracil-DNA glycosylase family 4